MLTKLKNYLRGRMLFSDGSFIERFSRESLIYVENDLKAEIDLMCVNSIYTAYVDSNRCIEGAFRNVDHVMSVRKKIEQYFAKNRMQGKVD
jgi:hypothetical protein